MSRVWVLIYDFLLPIFGTVTGPTDHLIFPGEFCDEVPHLVSIFSDHPWYCLSRPICFEELNLGMNKIMDFDANPDDPPYSFPNLSIAPLRNSILDFFSIPDFSEANELREIRIFQRSKDRVITTLGDFQKGLSRKIENARVSTAEFDRMCLREQIEFVRGADVLVGAHGSGLALTMFMREGAVLVEIFPYKFTCRDWIERAANYSGVNYVAYHPESEAEAAGEIDDGTRKCFDGDIACASALCFERLRMRNITVNVESFWRQVGPQLL
jgi:hypothetical protein